MMAEKFFRWSARSKLKRKAVVTAEASFFRNHERKMAEELAGTTGLEPATSDVTGRRSNQLNYVPACQCAALEAL